MHPKQKPRKKKEKLRALQKEDPFLALIKC
jgi:hypothetical protein